MYKRLETVQHQKEEKQEEAEEASGRRKVGKMECRGGGAT